MNVRERCSCGAEFQAEGSTAVRLLKEWRELHSCPDAPEPESGYGAGAQVERADDPNPPELHVGFRPYFGVDE